MSRKNKDLAADLCAAHWTGLSIEEDQGAIAARVGEGQVWTRRPELSSSQSYIVPKLT